MTKINDFLKDNLTAKQYEQLPTMLQVTQTKFSRLVSGTDQFEGEQLKKIMLLTNSTEPYQFILENEVNNNISVDELTALMQFFNDKVRNYAEV